MRISLNKTGNARNALPNTQQSSKVGFIDHLGKVVVKPIYDSAGFFREGLTHVTEADNLIVLDSTLTQLSVMSNAIPLLYFSEVTLVFNEDNGLD